ncbi:hypothetical protein EUGRSUZ_C00101 [Eucalyptus grandis]|uniref:Clp R domain-containing protein n=2 Tax=Eucalyptus grandis TaxID=71139 RepID=A0A059CJQ4_EUCGR|nr:hypothetical protein EUGRSUZ_C00101 [Eucalyptus grandis]
MRAGAYTVQQTLTAEAASVLKHSLSLARRRGHAQVTPLHVAATLLSSRSSLLRRACLKSQPPSSHPHPHPHHHHPLQCRALELCFNVALNRLPTTPGPMLHGQQASLSNALIAALKRAQAHQRRGCIEQQQQQPLLTIKVELEQLVISILDDPSVSRVMREAGFSSTAVKSNIEDSSASSVFQCYSSSGGVFSSPCSPSPADAAQQREVVINPSGSFWQTHLFNYSPEQNPVLFSPQKRVLSSCFVTDPVNNPVKEEDVKVVLEVLLRKNKRRNVVIVGDCFSQNDGLIGELMARIEKGEVPEELKSAQFIKFEFAPVSLRYMKREDVEINISELKRKIHDHSVAPRSSGGGVIIYTGDLKWTLETSNGGGEKNGEVSVVYSPVDHLVTEMGRLLEDYCGGSCAKVWLMATANIQTYMKCQMKQPALEVQWGLQPVSLPSGGLGLSLHASSNSDSKQPLASPPQVLEIKHLSKEERDGLTCCAECTSNYEKEADLFKSNQQKLLPSWLLGQGKDALRKEDLAELREKWNRLCHGLHRDRTRSYSTSTLYGNQSSVGKAYCSTLSHPWWPTQSTIFPDANSISFASSPLKPNQGSNTVPRFRRQQSCTIEFNSGAWTENKHGRPEPNLYSLKNTEGKEVKITLTLGNSLLDDPGKLAEQNIERMLLRGNMRRLLQDNVPWQSETIPAIVEALFNAKCTKKDSWLLILGNDTVGKRRLAHSIAESMFGSADFLFQMNMRTKRDKEASSDEIEARISKNDDKLVVLVEDIDLADKQFIRYLADRFETGKFTDSSQGEQNQGQVVFILTSGDSTGYDGRIRQSSAVQMTVKVIETTTNSNHKRKSEWGLSDKMKNPRTDGNKSAYLGSFEKGNIEEVLSRQSSFNAIDLNMKADEDYEPGGKPEDLSPNSSDLTRESSGEIQCPQTFLELIENRFTFNRSLTRDRETMEFFLSMIKKSFEGVYGDANNVRFSVEEGVLEEIVAGGGFFLNSLFEKWLKDIFQTALQIVTCKGRDGISFRLCLGGKGEGNLEEGFMSTCLPKKIQISYGD